MYSVISKETGEIVYSGEYKSHAEIYINTCHNPWEYEIKETHKKVFISLPMTGRSDEDIKFQMESVKSHIIELIGSKEIEFLDSFFPFNLPEGYNEVWYLAKSIELLAQADYVYFCPGWEDSRGCNVERKCCEDYGIKIIED